MKTNSKRPSKRPHPSGHDSTKAAIANPNKVMAEKFRRVCAEREMIKRTTIGLYSLKVGDSLFGLPFCALTDVMALKAQKELLPQANCYRIGSFCQYDCKVVSLERPVLVLDRGVENG